MPGKPLQRTVRPACGSGRWFPASPKELQAMVGAFIDSASVSTQAGQVVAAIAPHAGYIYSGKVAGFSFRAIKDASVKPDTVVIAGFSHQSAFNGVALMDGDVFSSPLGETPIDNDANRILCSFSRRIFTDYSPHMGEHSAENEIPFIQAALPDSKIVVAIMGDHEAETAEDFAAAVARLSESRKVLFVASTDLLHDPDYEKVAETDRRTLQHITDLDINALVKGWSFRNQLCCGIMPVITAMKIAKDTGCKKGILLDYRNSGDDFPESRGSWVVGYGAVIFTRP